tara:strand:- start:1820 stop:2308 length:489 start_codon:yes stop_codon:yes gene_type:complete
LPYKIRKRKCKQSSGKKGSYTVVKIKKDGGTEKESCHTSKNKAKGAVRARYAGEANEEKTMKITRKHLIEIIKEELSRALHEAEARPGPLGIAVDAEPPSIYEDDNSGEQAALDAEEEDVGSEENELRKDGTSPAASIVRNINHEKLAMMKQKSDTDADVSG